MVVEVLVHISTPATRQNDNIYRNLADVYLEFEPHSQYGHGPRRSDEESEIPTTAKPRTDVASKERTRGRPALDVSMLSTSKDSYGSFPSHLSSEGQETTNVGLVDDGSIPTSSRLARLDRIHARWQEQVTPNTNFVKGKRPSRPTELTSEEVKSTFIEDTQLGAQALQSQLQDSYSTTDEDASEGDPEPDTPLHEELSNPGSQRSTRNTGSDVRNATKSTPAVAIHETPSIHDSQRILRNKAVEVQETARTDFAAASTKFNVEHLDVSRLENTQKPSQSIAQAPNRKRKALDEIDCSGVRDFSKLSFDAFPPAPKVSIERPGRLPSQVTKHLGAIKAQNPKRFRYSKKHRTPKADERGYWAIACSSWSVKLQQEFWTTLCEHISSGRLGWGTTLHREASSIHTLGQIRLYCWAEIAEHVWLVLWLSSKGQVAGSESKWIDADGNVVFEVA